MFALFSLASLTSAAVAIVAAVSMHSPILFAVYLAGAVIGLVAAWSVAR